LGPVTRVISAFAFSLGLDAREKWRLLLPGASEPRLTVRTIRSSSEAVALLRRRDVLPHSCHLQLLRWPDNGGYHAERKHSLYALVDPVSPPSKTIVIGSVRLLLVEAPGTAPGSDRFITQAIYRHSRLPDRTNIWSFLPKSKGKGGNPEIIAAIFIILIGRCGCNFP